MSKAFSLLKSLIKRPQLPNFSISGKNWRWKVGENYACPMALLAKVKDGISQLTLQEIHAFQSWWDTQKDPAKAISEIWGDQ